MGEVYGFLSGKGGTGKTSVCAGLAEALANAGKRVLCIDCDVGLRNLDISLGMSDSGALSFLDIAQGGYSLDAACHSAVYPTLFFLTAPMNCRPESIEQGAFDGLLRDARARFDYVFLDAPAGVDAMFRLISRGADSLILVTGPGPAAVRDAARVAELLELSGKTQVRLVVNRIQKEMLTAVRLTVDDVMDATGVPLLGVVMEDPCVTLAAAFGQSLCAYSKRSPAAKAMGRMAKRLQGYSVPIPQK